MTAAQKEIQELKALVETLLARIAELEAEILRLKAPKKDSGNSSMPLHVTLFEAKRQKAFDRRVTTSQVVNVAMKAVL